MPPAVARPAPGRRPARLPPGVPPEVPGRQPAGEPPGASLAEGSRRAWAPPVVVVRQPGPPWERLSGPAAARGQAPEQVPEPEPVAPKPEVTGVGRQRPPFRPVPAAPVPRRRAGPRRPRCRCCTVRAHLPRAPSPGRRDTPWRSWDTKRSSLFHPHDCSLDAAPDRPSPLVACRRSTTKTEPGRVLA